MPPRFIKISVITLNVNELDLPVNPINKRTRSNCMLFIGNLPKKIIERLKAKDGENYARQMLTKVREIYLLQAETFKAKSTKVKDHLCMY